MRIADTQTAIPFLVLLIAVIAFLQDFKLPFVPTQHNELAKMIVFLGLGSWVGFARLIRGEVLSIRERDYVHAARALGVGDLRMMLRHIMPNAIQPAIVGASLTFGGLILTEAALSFLGLGVNTLVPTWGKMIADSRDYVTLAWHLNFPAVAIMLGRARREPARRLAARHSRSAPERPPGVRVAVTGATFRMPSRIESVRCRTSSSVLNPATDIRIPILSKLERRGQPLGLDQNVAFVVEPLHQALHVFLAVPVERQRRHASRLAGLRRRDHVDSGRVLHLFTQSLRQTSSMVSNGIQSDAHQCLNGLSKSNDQGDGCTFRTPPSNAQWERPRERPASTTRPRRA